MKNKLLFCVALLTASAATADTQTCATKAPPAAPAGWTHAGMQCNNQGDNCGTLCLCATKQAINFATKTVTFSCPCKAPKVVIVEVDGMAEVSPRLLTFSLSPYLVERFVGTVLGDPAAGVRGLRALAGLVATVELQLADGSVLAASSEPLSGDNLDLGIELPSVRSEDVVSYVFTLGKYRSEGLLDNRSAHRDELTDGLRVLKP